MTLAIIPIIGIVLFVVFRLMAHRPPPVPAADPPAQNAPVGRRPRRRRAAAVAADLAEEVIGIAQSALRYANARFALWYAERVIPWLKRLGWAALAILLAVGALAWFVLPASHLASPAAGGAVAIVAGISAFAIVLCVLRPRPVDFSTVGWATVPLIGIAAVSVTALAAGAVDHAHSLVMLGVALLLVAIQIFVWYAELVAVLSKEIGEFAQAISQNWVFSKAKEIGEKLDVGTTGLYRRLCARCTPIIVPLLLWPYPETLAACVFIGLIFHAIWNSLEAEDVKTKTRRQNAVLTLEMIAFAAIPLIIYEFFVPGGAKSVDAGRDWVFAILTGKEQVSYLWMVILVCVAVFAAKSVYPWKEDAKGKAVRQMLALLLVLPGAVAVVNRVHAVIPSKYYAKTEAAPAPIPSASATAVKTVTVAAEPPPPPPALTPTPPAPKVTVAKAAVPSPHPQKAPCPGAACERSKETLAMCESLGIPCD